MKSRFVISLDFELAWGSPSRWLDHTFINRCMLARDAAVEILNLLEQFDVCATWATVGALFADDKEHFLSIAPPEHLRPSYNDRSNSPYEKIQCITEENSGAFFCPEILRLLEESSGQEIASHTFAHYFCLEQGQIDAEFGADLQSFENITSEFGVKCTSMVFPRNQMNPNYIKLIVNQGITAIRGAEHSWIWKTRSRSERTPLVRLLRIADAFAPLARGNIYAELQHVLQQVVDVPSSRFLRPYSKATRTVESLKCNRILNEMRFAASSGGLYHLWFHPNNFAFHRKENMAAFKRVLNEFAQLRDSGFMENKTMAEVAFEESQPM